MAEHSRKFYSTNTVKSIKMVFNAPTTIEFDRNLYIMRVWTRPIYVDIFMVRIGWFLPILSTKSLALCRCSHFNLAVPMNKIYAIVHLRFVTKPVRLHVRRIPKSVGCWSSVWWFEIWYDAMYNAKSNEKKIQKNFYMYKYETTKRLIIFTEIGVCSVCGTHLDPTRWRNEC